MPLAEHILLRLNRQNNTTKVFSQSFKKALLLYSWPGNIRELSNIVERAYVLAQSDTLEVEDLPEEIASQWLGQKIRPSIHKNSTLHAMLEEVEAAILAEHLQENRTLQEIASDLGIDISTLVRKIKKYSLPKRYKRSGKEFPVSDG